MIICICHRVSDRDIARSVREGCESFDELQFELGVATGCGACHDCAQASFHEQRQARSLGAACAAPSTAVQTMPVRFLRRLQPVQGLGDTGLAGAAA